MFDWAYLIPLAPFMVGGLVIWTRHQQRMMELQTRDTAERAAQYAAGRQELEERVQVLERIVTDRGYDVATQIEALRDTRRVEATDIESGGRQVNRGEQTHGFRRTAIYTRDNRYRDAGLGVEQLDSR